MISIQLIPIDHSGNVTGAPGVLSDVVLEIAESMVPMYATTGFVLPWVGYIAWVDEKAVGTCAFKTPPHNDAVEIAYYTFPGFEGQGIATAMARALLHIAKTTAPKLVILAQTLPESNASTSILKKLGFDCIGSVIHPEDGEVWEWHLPAHKP